MDWPEAASYDLKRMANQLALLLNTEDREGRRAWENLHGKLADIAIGIADRTMTIEALLKKLQAIGSPQVLGYPDAEVLLRRMLKHVEEKVSAQRAAHASQAIPLLKSLILLVAGQLDMTPLCDSVPVEMIDGRDYIFAEETVDAMVNSSVELSAPNAPYSVVSILGAQSSGKSYLLNQLFGTKFPVLDARLGRIQTTKGISMSRCIEPSMLVLDTQGVDGRERWQDNSFENQAVLFALTVSDQIMINIGIYDIFSEYGGGQTLFKKIFQERTKLPPGLTNIVVVHRNDDGEIGLQSQDVMEWLKQTWKSVYGESTAFTDYIKINVVALPDMESPYFQKEVTTLRKLLTNFTESAKVPASSFSLILKMLWDQIKQNKKLDLLSLLSQHKDELLERQLNKLKVEVARLKIDAEAYRCHRQCSDDQASKAFVDIKPTAIDDAINKRKPFARGGFGEVYKAELGGRDVAIKVPIGRNMSDEESAFRKEVQILRRIRHPYIVILLGACIEKCVLVYEFLPNGTLEERLKEGKGKDSFPWEERIHVAAKISTALVYLHDSSPHPIVHGDLKPNNILFDAENICKLADFGISRFMQQNTTNGTPCHITNEPKGTSFYMDPEYNDGYKKLTCRADQFAFGIILLELVTGQGASGLRKLVSEQMEILDGKSKDIKIRFLSKHTLMDTTWKSNDKSKEVALEMLELGLRCSEKKGEDRPDFKAEVWTKINSISRSC